MVCRNSRGRSDVALLAEGVDRNIDGFVMSINTVMSPSSRRAWIEMLGWNYITAQDWVALLAEGVDRNHTPRMEYLPRIRRPPRGGRG